MTHNRLDLLAILWTFFHLQFVEKITDFDAANFFHILEFVQTTVKEWAETLFDKIRAERLPCKTAKYSLDVSTLWIL